MAPGVWEGEASLLVNNSELNIKAMRKEVFPDFKIILQFKAFHNNYEPEDTRLQISLWNNGYIFWLIS